MKKYLITGGEGFIGRKIVDEIDGISYDLKSGRDILNKILLKESAEKTEGVFHCAAKISVPESLLLPEEYYLHNVEGTRFVIEVAEQTGQKIVFSSSAAVYGDSDTAVGEDFKLNPKSPYAENKMEGENLLRNSKVAHIALRYFNVYGPGQSPQYAGVITSFINSALKGEDLIIYGDGKQVRDFVYVGDVVRANILAMNYENKNFEIFNIGSGAETTIEDLANTIIRLSGSSSKIVYQNPRIGDIIYSRGDVSRAKNDLGWEAKTTLEEGLRETILYYKNNYEN